MIDEIKKSITERVSKHTSSMCATQEEVWICWLLTEVERLNAEVKELRWLKYNIPLGKGGS